MPERVVMIGAGGSGRGFLARLLQEDGACICFLDRDHELVAALRREGRYGIRVGQRKEKIMIQNYEAFPIEEEEAVSKAAEADWIFISVGADHLAELVPFLEKAAVQKKAPLRLIPCENGISPKKILRDALKNTKAQNSLVSQGVIFCTSIPEKSGSLDIVSEDYQKLPYDVDEDLFRLPFAHFPATTKFDQLLQRKIYTYNCLSACIAYLGSYMGYEIYAEAANNTLINRCCGEVAAGLNRAICQSMKISLEDQQKFSAMAMKKFSNPDISDTIYKNVRGAVRKLAPAERIMGPMALMEEVNEDTEVLLLVAAAALLYLERKEEPVYRGRRYSDVARLFIDLNPQLPKETLDRICGILERLRQGERLDCFMEKKGEIG